MTDVTRSLRADARRNHATLLQSARDLYVERGPDVPLDEIARRAGVGIGTLYRRFTDRQELMIAVVLDALEHTANAAEQAAREHREPFAALAAYMHAVIDVRTPAVIPALLGRLDLEAEDLAVARNRSAAAAQALIDAAHADGSLRADATFGDIGLMLVRIARPLPGNFPAEEQSQLAHRHVDLVLAALASPGGGDLAGPALERRDLSPYRPPGHTPAASSSDRGR